MEDRSRGVHQRPRADISVPRAGKRLLVSPQREPTRQDCAPVMDDPVEVAGRPTGAGSRSVSTPQTGNRIADQDEKFRLAVPQDLCDADGLAGVLGGLGEVHENRHDLTRGQPRDTTSLLCVGTSLHSPSRV